ncbi:MAG TPA: exosortase N [Saprospiraceae bacterium]|nr:exosortase N [Saprospiraceae bacterium]HPI05911.1 exosortase N [Saprospiraceae bacterium]
MSEAKFFQKYRNNGSLGTIGKEWQAWLLLLFFVAVTVFWMQAGYLQNDVTFMAGLAVMVFSTVVRRPGEGNWRFAIWFALCFGMALTIPARTFHFLALVFAAGFVFENLKGKINEAPVLTAFLLTAVFKTMSIVLGFAIRLQLSENAATALRGLGKDAVAEGNLIRFEGQDFYVDPACMGLQMVDVSFLFGFFLLGLLERRTGKRLSWPALLIVVSGLGLLNLIFNQLRIIFLVLFKILPENPLHEAVGLAGLTLYVFVPAWFGIGWLFRRSERSAFSNSTAIPETIRPRLKQGAHILLFLCIGWLAASETSETSSHVNNVAAIIPQGLPVNCAGELLQDGVVKYTPDSLIIYVKPIRGFYSTEHSPLICWQGSGYVFGKVWEQQVNGKTCYNGILQKSGSPILYTAWWFDNGQAQTVSQFRWRWLDIGGAPGFSLVNVTAADPEVLQQQLIKMLSLLRS